MRTTLTIDDDVAALIEKENRRANEPMKQTVNRVLRLGLNRSTASARPRRFVVKAIDTGMTKTQWAAWEGKKLEEILEEEEGRAR